MAIGPFGSNLKVPDYREEGVPLVFVRHVRAESFAETHYVTPEKAGELAAHAVVGGDLLITKMGEPPGDSAIYPMGSPDAIITADCIKWRLAPAGLDPKFFNYALRSETTKRQIANRTRGVAQKKISLERFKDIALPLPALPEQRRIVARLEELFSRLEAGVAALRHAKTQLQRYRQSVLAAAVTGQLTQAWREQHPDTEPAEELLKQALSDARANWSGKRKFVEPAILNPEGLPELPSTWTWTGVEQTGEVKLGRQRSPKQMTGDHIRPYLRVANVYEDRIDTTDINEMNFTPDEFKIYELKYGDILLNEGQSLEWVGRPAMYRDEIEGCCFQNTLVRYRAHYSVLPSYALIVFRAYLHRGRFQKIAKWTNNIAHLGAGRFKEIEFPLPPLAEQHQIVAKVEARTTAIDHLEAELARQITRSNRLRQSTLATAFQGNL
ncbi:MAG: restriction endonuclease subunit S [Verrucomicrobiae bacterium]|nr:restriction endonuclease subunit S [Verrucomicrobiae bacterium]